MSDCENLMSVLRSLVDVVGLRPIVLALAAVCSEKAIASAADEPGLAHGWQNVAERLERVAHSNLRGLR